MKKELPPQIINIIYNLLDSLEDGDVKSERVTIQNIEYKITASVINDSVTIGVKKR